MLAIIVRKNWNILILWG